METRSTRAKVLIGAALSATAAGALGAWMWNSGRLRIRGRYPYIACSLKKIVASPSKRPPPQLGAPLGGIQLDPAEYPWVRRDESFVENLHGVDVPDPYRWLEEPDDSETAAFVEAQNTLFNAVMDGNRNKEEFGKSLKVMYDYPKHGCPFKEGGRYYYFHNTGLQNQNVLFSQDSLDAESSMFLDPNTWSEDGTEALGSKSFSKDGRYMAYSISSGGSDWRTIKALEVGEDGKPTELKDELKFAKFTGMEWTHDNRGFFYCRYPEPSSGNRELGRETTESMNKLLCYHVIGTPQSEDRVVFTTPDKPKWLFSPEVSDDGKYLVIHISDGCDPANRVYLIDLHQVPKTADGKLDFSVFETAGGKRQSPVVKLVDNFNASYSYVANDGPVFTFQTDLDAPRYKVVRTDVSRPVDPKKWSVLVAESEKDVIEWVATPKGDNMIICYMRDCCNQLDLHSLSTGALKSKIDLPGYVSIRSIFARREHSEVFLSAESFIDPVTTYRLDLEKDGLNLEVFKKTEIPGYDSSEYETVQHFARSYDGTEVPMFVTHKKGLALNGQNPTVMYGYGGFKVSLMPTFSVSRTCFLNGFNGVWAHTNLRGGGEYGTEWYDAGCFGKKQNVFDDFHSCAEYLIKSGYTSPDKLAIRGGSNGGLLVATCLNQRPDLYGCGIAQVGVLDMLRFHKFTIGHAWATVYGNPDKPEDFEYIYEYSPLHNIHMPSGGSMQYPSILLTTADHDDRVSPLHTFKFLAALQHVLVSDRSSPQRNPLLARIDVKSGHGAGKPTEKLIEEERDIIGFFTTVLKAKWLLGE